MAMDLKVLQQAITTIKALLMNTRLRSNEQEVSRCLQTSFRAPAPASHLPHLPSLLQTMAESVGLHTALNTLLNWLGIALCYTGYTVRSVPASRHLKGF